MHHQQRRVVDRLVVVNLGTGPFLVLCAIRFAYVIARCIISTGWRILERRYY